MAITSESVSKALDGFDWSALKKPNPFFVAMMGHDKWYMKPLVRFAPKFIHTFTERRPDGERVGHGYTCHHPLEFLYRWARRLATRKQKFVKVDRIEGRSFTVPLRGE